MASQMDWVSTWLPMGRCTGENGCLESAMGVRPGALLSLNCMCEL